MWQDLVFSLGQCLFIAALVPAVLSAQKPPKSTCLLTGMVLTMFALTFLTLGLKVSAVSSGISALMVIILLLQKRQRQRIGEEP